MWIVKQYEEALYECPVFKNEQLCHHQLLKMYQIFHNTHLINSWVMVSGQIENAYAI